MEKKNILTLGLIGSMFIWGMSWPSGKVLSSYGSPALIASCRFFTTFLGLLPILIISKESLSIHRNGLPYLLASGLCMSLYSFLFFHGLKYGLSGAGGVLVTTLNPVIAYGLGLALHKKKPTFNETAGLLLGILAGCILLKIWTNVSDIFSSGNIYFLLASITWAVLSKFTSKASQFGSSVAFSFWMYLICSLFVAFLIPAHEPVSLWHKMDALFAWNMFFSAIITTSIATTFYFYATSRLGAEKASSFIFLVPTSAALSAMVFLGEVIKWNTIVGGMLGVAAVLMINKK